MLSSVTSGPGAVRAGVKGLAAGLVLAGLVASSVHAQTARKETNVQRQREAVEAWTACIADDFGDDVHTLMLLDFRSDEYRRLIDDMADRRVSSECFGAIPRRYRRIELGGLPFAGGLAEQAMESESDEPLLQGLAMASIGKPAETFSYTDKVANCTVRGGPHLVAALFDSPVETDAETAALDQLQPVIDVCSQGGSTIDASPLAIRSMLATASYRILAAQDNSTDESEDDA